jgi:hypothetical protein
MAKYFGKGATPETLTPAVDRLLLAQKFARQKKTATVISDADIEKYYNEHKNDYDVVTYRAFTFKSDAADTATDAEKTTAAAAAHTKAEAMATLVSDEESFKAQALANATADEKEHLCDERCFPGDQCPYPGSVPCPVPWRLIRQKAAIRRSWMRPAPRQHGPLLPRRSIDISRA